MTPCKLPASARPTNQPTIPPQKETKEHIRCQHRVSFIPIIRRYLLSKIELSKRNNEIASWKRNAWAEWSKKRDVAEY